MKIIASLRHTTGQDYSREIALCYFGRCGVYQNNLIYQKYFYHVLVRRKKPDVYTTPALEKQCRYTRPIRIEVTERGMDLLRRSSYETGKTVVTSDNGRLS